MVVTYLLEELLTTFASVFQRLVKPFCDMSGKYVFYLYDTYYSENLELFMRFFLRHPAVPTDNGPVRSPM